VHFRVVPLTGVEPV